MAASRTAASTGGQYLPVYKRCRLLITITEGACCILFFLPSAGLCAEITSSSNVSVRAADAGAGRLRLRVWDCSSRVTPLENGVSPPWEKYFPPYLYIDVWEPEMSPALELSISGAVFGARRRRQINHFAPFLSSHRGTVPERRCTFPERSRGGKASLPQRRAFAARRFD